MNKSVWYNAVKAYYGRFYTKEQVKLFVVAGKITEDEYKELVGEKYVA